MSNRTLALWAKRRLQRHEDAHPAERIPANQTLKKALSLRITFEPRAKYRFFATDELRPPMIQITLFLRPHAL